MKYGFSLGSRRSCFTVLFGEQSRRRISFLDALASIHVAENGKLTRYRANVTIDYLSLLSAINDSIPDDAASPRRLSDARRANYESFFCSSAIAFTKYRSARAISYTRVQFQVSLAHRVAVDGH